MKFVYVIFSFLIFSAVSFADVIDTKWEGPSELYKDGSVFCSYDQSKNFNNFLNHVFVKSLIIENIENDQLNIELVFTHSSIGAELEFIALMQQTL